MDYLHGDVVDGEFRAACQYEYARQSAVLQRASQIWRDDPEVDDFDIVSQLTDKYSGVSWLVNLEWSFIWRCPSFPAKSWNQLRVEERTDLLRVLPLSTTTARALRLGEVMFLTPYLDQLKEMADRARAESKEALAAERQRERIYPILELKNTPFVQALLPLDFSKSKTRLLEEIDLWLQLPENKARFDKHEMKTEAGTEKEAKDRLKDLAAWKLFRELGWHKALQFAERHRKSDESGRPRAFHDPRQGRKEQGKLTKVPPNEAPLYSWQTGEAAFRKAKMRVDHHLAEIIPWEFGRYAEESETFGREMVGRFIEALKAAPKTSKSSS